MWKCKILFCNTYIIFSLNSLQVIGLQFHWHLPSSLESIRITRKNIRLQRSTLHACKENVIDQIIYPWPIIQMDFNSRLIRNS